MGILIVNPNPIFDRTISIVELVPGAVIRTLDVELTAGGKGINVARVLRALGRPAPLLIPVGVDDLPRYADLLSREGAQFATVSVPGGVRTASIYLEQAHDRVTVVNDAGTPMSAATVSAAAVASRGRTRLSGCHGAGRGGCAASIVDAPTRISQIPSTVDASAPTSTTRISAEPPGVRPASSERPTCRRWTTCHGCGDTMWSSRPRPSAARAPSAPSKARR